MAATATAPSPTAALSHGQAISYKAFGRNFTQDLEVGVLYLMATCSYPTNGFTIFFEPVAGDPAKFSLMEQPPTGIFLNLVTYYAAVWRTDGVSDLQAVPKYVTIVDAEGEHRIRVEPWS